MCPSFFRWTKRSPKSSIFGILLFEGSSATRSYKYARSLWEDVDVTPFGDSCDPDEAWSVTNEVTAAEGQSELREQLR